MTITNQTPRSGPYNGDGGTVAFSYNFLIDAEDELVVVLASSIGVETVQTLTTDYTVSGVGNSAGGTVTFVTAPASGETVSIRRAVTQEQTTDLQNRGAVIPQTVEDRLDDLTKMVQDLQEQLDRAPLTKLTDNLTGLQIPTGSGNKAIGWNGAGDELVNLTPAGSGDIFVPGASTDNAIVRWDGAGGATVQNSVVTVGDGGDIAGVSLLSANVLSAANSLIHTDDSDTKLAFTTDAIDIQTGGSSRIDLSNSGVRLGGANARVTTILDEDDMASDSATALVTQQSLVSYVIPKSLLTTRGDIIYRNATVPARLAIGSARQLLGNDGTDPTWRHPITKTADTSTSGAGSYTQAVPSGVEWLKVAFDALSLSGTDAVDVRIGTSSALVATGYDGWTALIDSTSTNSSAVTAGARLQLASAGRDATGTATFVHQGGNKWTYTLVYGEAGTDAIGLAAGTITLAGELDIVGVAATGANTFDGGTYSVSYM